MTADDSDSRSRPGHGPVSEPRTGAERYFGGLRESAEYAEAYKAARRPSSRRFTRAEEDALLMALAQALAAPLDGVDDADMDLWVGRMESAQRKLWDRQERR